MNSLDARRDEDVSKLRELEKRTGGRVRVTQVSGRPIETIALQLQVRTAGNAKFPAQAVGEVNARIQLAARYPFVEPSVVLSTRVFNPNVYESGRVCFGAKWLPTEYLDLLAQRLFKILAFDAAIINVMSARTVRPHAGICRPRAAIRRTFRATGWLTPLRNRTRP
jgi:hypothetical protein